MSKQLIQKSINRAQRKRRIRSQIKGTSDRPRLTIFISHLNVSAQLIDDTKQATLASVTTVGKKAAKGNLTEKAEWVGSEIAKAAKLKKVKKVVFDRNGKLYHGRVAALAEAARKEGLEF